MKPELMNLLTQTENGFQLKTWDTVTDHCTDLDIETEMNRDDFTKSEDYAEAIALNENSIIDDLKNLKEFFLKLAV